MDERNGKMTKEKKKMEGHEPHGHSYVWDAHMKRKGKNCMAMYIGGRVVHRNGKKGNSDLVRSHRERNRRDTPRLCREQTLGKDEEDGHANDLQFLSHGLWCRLEDNERE
jgi:hypothetical protein